MLNYYNENQIWTKTYETLYLEQFQCLSRMQFPKNCLNNIILTFRNFRIPTNGVLNDSAVQECQGRRRRRDLRNARKTLNILKSSFEPIQKDLVANTSDSFLVSISFRFIGDGKHMFSDSRQKHEEVGDPHSRTTQTVEDSKQNGYSRWLEAS